MKSISEELLIESHQSTWRSINLKEIWRYRELVYFLSLRDIKVKYKQAILGVVWVIAQPLFTVLTYTFLFGKVAKIASDGLPYAAFAFSGLVPWTFFISSLSKGSLSIAGSGALFSKVYFPRLIIPLAAVLGGVLDYLISFLCLVGLLLYYGFVPQGVWLIGLPLVTVWIFFFATGVSFWLGALNVKYRDVGHILPFLIQIWMFLTPIVYPLSVLPAKYLFLVRLNPMVGIVDAYRAILFNRSCDLHSIWISLLISALIFFSGMIYFAKTERTFADIV